MLEYQSSQALKYTTTYQNRPQMHYEGVRSMWSAHRCATNYLEYLNCATNCLSRMRSGLLLLTDSTALAAWWLRPGHLAKEYEVPRGPLCSVALPAASLEEEYISVMISQFLGCRFSVQSTQSIHEYQETE